MDEPRGSAAGTGRLRRRGWAGARRRGREVRREEEAAQPCGGLARQQRRGLVAWARARRRLGLRSRKKKRFG